MLIETHIVIICSMYVIVSNVLCTCIYIYMCIHTYMYVCIMYVCM